MSMYGQTRASRMDRGHDARKLGAGPRKAHIPVAVHCRVPRASPDTATAETSARFSCNRAETGTSICNLQPASLPGCVSCYA